MKRTNMVNLFISIGLGVGVGGLMSVAVRMQSFLYGVEALIVCTALILNLICSSDEGNNK